jgi:selenium metabolism protein YedF
MKETATIINAKGLACPKPLILTKKQLDSSPATPFITIVDNITAKNNIERFLSDKKIIYSTTEVADNFEIFINSKNNTSQLDTNIPKQNTVKGYNSFNTVICLKSLTMGEGNTELGEILLKAFISTIKEVSPLPETIIFYNSAVKLTENNSSIISELSKLADKGVKLIICGTCAEYYGLTDKIKIGIISNMYEILEILNKSDKIIYP